MVDFDISFLQFAANYPFTPIAKEFLRTEHAISWSIMERAAQRVEDSQMGEVSCIESDERELLEREILSFAVAKAIASLCVRTCATKWISGEAKRATKLLRSSWIERKGDVWRFAEQFGITLSGLTIDIKSYLRYIPKEPTARLVLQDIRAGQVALSENRLFEIFGEAAASAIQKGFPIPEQRIPPSILPDVRDFASKINRRFAQARAHKLRTVGGIAPCMEKIIRSLEAGEMVPHSARWTIATYLLQRGAGEERVVELFRATPNFNEKRTRYYVEHIKKKGYSVPSCAVIDSYGLCVEKCGIKNPLHYWGKK